MKISIHQPEHIPWLGFFDKMIKSEKFIILDDVQFRKNYFQNRNKIVSSSGVPKWVSVPVIKGSLKQRINEKIIMYNGKIFPNKYISLIIECYKESRFFKQYSENIFEILLRKHEKLIDLNMELIKFFRHSFEIENQLFFSSDLEVTGDKSNLIFSICKAVGASTYLSGPSGKDYLNIDTFTNAGINVEFNEYIQKEYESPNYYPFLSSIDYLFRVGPNLFKKKLI